MELVLRKQRGSYVKSAAKVNDHILNMTYQDFARFPYFHSTFENVYEPLEGWQWSVLFTFYPFQSEMLRDQFIAPANMALKVASWRPDKPEAFLAKSTELHVAFRTAPTHYNIGAYLLRVVSSETAMTADGRAMGGHEELNATLMVKIDASAANNNGIVTRTLRGLKVGYHRIQVREYRQVDRLLEDKLASPPWSEVKLVQVRSWLSEVFLRGKPYFLCLFALCAAVLVAVNVAMLRRMLTPVKCTMRPPRRSFFNFETA